ncbi:Glutamate--tRNA ligase 1 [Planctomycetes bacterium Pan216]|uniref:Glutamate--tRNA ligase n=1 Tax=Kolteria novifilia TaxID=2527975 RepID=A0A518AYH6_9BACT|nr:Glutamate--tRNA ligase 1 [Planctomycetes bacterium Pan216]
MEVRTRFAPSPTGYLHIGGVRTALFNWLLARRHGGQFILRIDDTDTARHVDDALTKIFEGMRWLGLDWDEGPDVGGAHGPYFQSQRTDNHVAAITQLLESGKAYPCETSTTELDELREAAKAAKRPFVFRGPNRDMSGSEALALWKEKQCAVRFKVPQGKTTVLLDAIRGAVEWRTDMLGDFTIARDGGKPLYNLASIVDDIETKITHVVRAEEHLSNTHPQLLIAEGLGAPLPTFAHVPYVAAPGGKKKLSKRNPPPGVMVALEEYEQAGYLPEALVNALARLGWSLDDHTEIMSRQTIIENFSLDRVTSAPAGLDPDKMYWIQDQYMTALPADEKIELMMPFLVRAGLVADPPTPEQKAVVAKIEKACGDRLKLLSDIIRYGAMFLREELVIDPKAMKHLRKPGAEEVLAKLHATFATLEPFDLATIEAAVNDVREETGVGGKINHFLRASTTGETVGPGVFDCIEILGREKVLKNIETAREKIAAEAG